MTGRPLLAVRARTVTLPLRWDPLPVAGWLLGFAPVLYLGLQGGGYDPIVRNQVGIAIWWIVLLGAAIGVLPRGRMGPAALTAIALVAGLVAWTLVGTLWSESAEQTVDDAGKVAVYVGILVLALAVQGRAEIRHLLDGVAAAIVGIVIVALLYRVHQPWFAISGVDAAFPDGIRRLSYPLNYWNALAALTAMGIPLVLRAATGARTLAMRSAAAAALPLMALCVFFTVSRGGVAAVAIAVAAFLLLAPDRLARLPTLLAAAAGSAILIAGADQREALTAGLRTVEARHQGDELLALIVVTCLGVALVQLGIALALRYGERPAWTRLSRRTTTIAAATTLVVVVVIGLAAGAGGTLRDEWNHFKQADAGQANAGRTVVQRFDSLSGNGRYQFWQSAAKAHQSEPLHGIGSGTFEYWWARNGTLGTGFVRDAHSLYLETWGELGWIGLLLVGGFVALVLGAGLLRCLRARSDGLRLGVAAATASAIAFAAVAAVEWIWEIAVIPAVLMLLAGVILARDPSAPPRANAARPLVRAGLAALALAAIVVVAIPLVSTSAVRESQALASRNQLGAALGQARTAARVTPYSASALLQQALVLERAGDLSAALPLAQRAADAEPTNWRTWLVVSRLAARSGEAKPAVAAYRRARALNPNSVLFHR